MPVSAASLMNAVDKVRKRMAEIEHELNEADGRLGDGDTGVMLRRALDAMADTDEHRLEGVDATLRELAMKCASSTGSSLGTLIASGMLAAAKEVSEQQDIEWHRLSVLLSAARQAMMERGKTELGDKTVLDTLDAVARGVDGKATLDETRLAALGAARSSLVEFREKPCRAGRARIYADKSIGMDDPGMLALTRCIEAICEDA